MLTLGFDTSNYTTSVAAFDGVGGKNCSRLLDVKPGELGLRQSDALFAHVKRLPELVQALCASVELKDITAIGVSYLLQNAALLLFGSQQMAYPTLVKLGSFSVGGVQVDGITVLTLAVTAVLMAALTLFIDKTKLGKAMRAVSEDKDAATLMGINVDRTITLTFAIGSALAGVAAIFYGAAYTYIRPTTGAMPGIKAFTAAVFGGIGSIPGAFLGGLLLGIIEAMAKAYISTNLANSIVFAVLIVVLLVKPAGLLGKSVTEKV